jgi:SAM-dependent methyltransferase
VDPERPWYETAFERSYLDVYPHRDLAAARVEVAGLLERGVRGRTLDLGCGSGRHSLAMRERGIDVVGLDLSRELLEVAAALGDAALRRRLVRGDFRALPFRARAFDAVLMLFSSFGYFGDAENALVLSEVARVLRKGGSAILDLMNPGHVRARLVPESREERDGLVIHERRRLAGARVVKDVRLTEPDGRARSWREDVRLYEPAEIAALLAAHGLAPLRVEGDFDGSAHALDSPRQIIWAEKS